MRVKSDARESNAVTPDPKSGGVASAPRIRRPAYPPRTRRPVPLPGLEPGTSAFVVRRSVHLSHRGEVETSARLHRRSAWPPLRRRGRALGNVFGYQGSLKWAASSTGGGNRTLWKRFWRPLRFPSSPIRELISGAPKREAALIGFPMGGSRDMTSAMAS